MTPTQKDKLWALAAVAGAATKEGDMIKATSALNIMASIVTDGDVEQAEAVFDTLAEIDPKGPKVNEYISGVKLGGIDCNIDDEVNVDLSRFTHEEALFILVTLLGGNLRGAIKSEGEERAKAGRNVSNLLNIILRVVTESDWLKAKAMVEGGEPPVDPFQNYLSA